MDIYDEEINELYLDDDEYLEHYGTKKHSGRYPWGSGDKPFQRSGDFLSRYEELKKNGLSEKEIAESFGVYTTKLRALVSIATNERRADLVARARSLKEDGMTATQIAEVMGLKGESSARSLLNSDSEARMKIAEITAQDLRALVDEKGMLDIGVGVGRQMGGISQERMNQAIEILKLEGYEVFGANVPQTTNPGRFTRIKVLAKPGTEHRDIYEYDQIGTLNDYVSMDGETFQPGFIYPASMDSNRVQIRYAEEGGSEKDGLIEIRRNVDDLSLGASNYSQVRILVDGTHYMKGMAVYSDDLPPGIDIIYNTNKSSDKAPHDVFKKITSDPDNPFGSTIKENGGQSYFTNEKGEPQLSLINKRSDEGDWGQWSKELSSQFLSKQPIKLINQQLNLSLADKTDEYDEIMSLTNPTVKKALLVSFADNMDSAAVHLKAASLPGVQYKVILPINSLKDNEVYAPHLKDGTEVALVRYPHAGIFEIPVLKVNNRNKDARNIIGTNPADAIGINMKVASQLSGADFDGDTAMVIPLSDKVKIKAKGQLEELKDFDTRLNYGPDTIKIINGEELYFRGGIQYRPFNKTAEQQQMGSISNLITDMTLRGANDEELVRAVKHSMVVIDTAKHHLNYKQSEKDNGIKELKNTYQGRIDEETGRYKTGAYTLISKAKSKAVVLERKEGAFFAKDTGNELIVVNMDDGKKFYLDPKTNKSYDESGKRTLYTDPVTGEKLFHDTNREFKTTYYTNSNGKRVKSSVILKDNKAMYKDEDGKWTQVTPEMVIVSVKATENSTLMAETKDAHTLSSGTTQEEAYATYANKLKALALQARKESMSVLETPYSPSARLIYLDEVTSLDYKLNKALLNAPKERQAQYLAASAVKAKKQDNPRMSSEELKKLGQQELSRARIKVGAQRSSVIITPKEWQAIQAGAISKTRLKQIIANSDLDVLRQLAMPRTTTTLSEAKIKRIQNMAKSGYTTSEIANALGVSSGTVTNYLKGG